MLQELAAESGAGVLAIASMFFFIGVWVWIAIRVYGARPEEMDALARLALEGDDAHAEHAAEGSRTKA